MSYNKPIRRIAIVGTGVIGASWAAEYLARGFDVITTDPGPNAEANLRKYIDEVEGPDEHRPFQRRVSRSPHVHDRYERSAIESGPRSGKWTRASRFQGEVVRADG